MGGVMASLTSRAIRAFSTPGTLMGLGWTSNCCSCIGSFLLPQERHSSAAVPERAFLAPPVSADTREGLALAAGTACGHTEKCAMRRRCRLWSAFIVVQGREVLSLQQSDLVQIHGAIIYCILYRLFYLLDFTIIFIRVESKLLTTLFCSSFFVNIPNLDTFFLSNGFSMNEASNLNVVLVK